MYLFYIPRTQMTPILKGQPPQTRPFPIKTGVIWVLGIYIYTMLTVLQLHQDTYNILIKPLMGDRDYPDSPKSCKSFEKRGQRRESVPSNLFALLCLRTERWARAGLSPCATRHPGLFPTAQRHGLLLRTEVDTEKPWFRGWMSGAAEFNIVSWRQRRKRKTHTQKYVSSGCEILLAILLSFLFLMCLMCSPVWR